MKKFLILVATIIIVCSCGETSTPTGKKEITPAKTNSNYVIPLALGNKWIYKSGNDTLTMQVKSVYYDTLFFYGKFDYDKFEQTYISKGMFNIYEVIITDNTNPPKNLTRNYTYYDNKVYTGYTGQNNLYGDAEVLIGDETLKSYKVAKYLDFDLPIGTVKNASLFVYDDDDKPADINNIIHGDIFKKGIGIVAFYSFGKYYELIDVVLN